MWGTRRMGYPSVLWWSIPHLRCEMWGTRHPAKLFGDEDDGQAVGWDGEAEVAVVEAEMFGWRHCAGGAQFGDLGLGEVAGRAAHGVEGFEDVAVVVVDAPDFGACEQGDVLELEVEGLRGAGGTSGHSVGGAGSGGRRVVPQGEDERAGLGFGD